MLPLLPALLLLLLQGPSNVERLAQDGRLPEALNSLHRRMHESANANDLAMSSLLAVGSDASLVHALATILATNEPAKEAVVSVPAVDESSPRVLPNRGAPRLCNGFEKYTRTRDGPLGC